MAKMPYMQFYPSDWIQDTQVLTQYAKGCWMDILCQLWLSSTPGTKRWTRREFTTLLPHENHTGTEQLVVDLASVATIILTDQSGHVVSHWEECAYITVESRRIVRDMEKITARKETYKTYNHTRTTSQPHENHTRTTPRSQKSEVRSQKSEEEKKKESPLTPLAGGKCAVAVQLDEDFEKFWVVYPRKVGKKAAYRSWQKARDKPTIEATVLSVQHAMRSQKWRDGYIPNPATWINQGRWDDVVTDAPCAPTPKAYQPTPAPATTGDPCPPEVAARLAKILGHGAFSFGAETGAA